MSDHAKTAHVLVPELGDDAEGAWVCTYMWNGVVTTEPCRKHSFAWSGAIPCTGYRRCIFCGKPENAELAAHIERKRHNE